MAKNRDTETVVNIVTPGSVVGIVCGGDIDNSTVIVNGSNVGDSSSVSGRWIDPADIDRSRNSNPDNPDY